MYLDVEKIIYVYMFICAALLFFNLFYILRSKTRHRKLEQWAGAWVEQVKTQLGYIAGDKGVERSHQDLLKRKLVHIDSLLAYGIALDNLSREQPDCLGRYVLSCQESWQFLATQYKKKDSMYRAYFAYLISSHYPGGQEEFIPIMEILLSFLYNSTVYCRENVLNALYALGNSQAVESALQTLHDWGWFHHQKLLADGFLRFTGDKEELAFRLWGHLGEWNEEVLVSVVQFIAGFSDNYKEIFFPVLGQENVELEVRLAILRYYRRHIYQPVLPRLLSYMREPGTEDSLKIVTAFVLTSYPGRETVKVLKDALHHPNWYVRHNAAASLAALEPGIEDLQDILDGQDQYAREMLGYVLEDAGAGGK